MYEKNTYFFFNRMYYAGKGDDKAAPVAAVAFTSFFPGAKDRVIASISRSTAQFGCVKLMFLNAVTLSSLVFSAYLNLSLASLSST